MFNSIMEIDAMQYASISRELLRTDNFLFLFDNGEPYLDKPPLIFWVTSFFFKIFGVSNFTYRLPSFLFSLMTIYSTYKLSNIFYSKRISIIASLILSSTLTLTIINGDVRTDIYMIGPMMLAFWKLIEYFQFKNISSLVIGSISLGFSMMGKGPLGLIIPVIVIGINLIYKKELYKLLDKNIIIGLLFLLLTLMPMSIGLYNQFGFHGIKFFYWTQSFGRITGESNWSNNTGPFYLLNVFLYSFLPWTFVFAMAFLEKTKILFSKNKTQNKEVIFYIGFIFPLIILSLSNYKLPHYIYSIVPFASILTAKRIESWSKSKSLKKVYFFQIFLNLILVITSFLVVIIFMPQSNYFFFFPIAVVFIFLIFNKFSKESLHRFFIPSIASSIILSYFINLGILKPILAYQSQSNAAEYLNENFDKNIKIVFFKENEKAKSRSFNYYLDLNTTYAGTEDFHEKVKNNNVFIFTHEEGFQELLANYSNIKLLKTFEHFRVSKVNKKFINYKTRESTLQKKYLLQMNNT